MNPVLLSADGMSGLVFLGVLVVTVVGAIIAVGSARLVRAVAGLALSFLGVAGLYYYLESPFVSIMQILIYVGAVCVTIVFAVMLADPQPRDVAGSGPVTALLGGLTGLALFAGLAQLGALTNWPAAAERVGDGSIERIGQELLTSYSMVFELISVVLLVAIVGSLVLARSGRGT
ncbi:MAG: NADH-quinone oxidoreductase subunit J [Thermodesulfobacteriota bacterium]